MSSQTIIIHTDSASLRRPPHVRGQRIRNSPNIRVARPAPGREKHHPHPPWSTGYMKQRYNITIRHMSAKSIRVLQRLREHHELVFENIRLDIMWYRRFYKEIEDIAIGQLTRTVRFIYSCIWDFFLRLTDVINKFISRIIDVILTVIHPAGRRTCEVKESGGHWSLPFSTPGARQGETSSAFIVIHRFVK